MILFSEIFNRAVNLFDDPDIRQKYYIDPVGFQRVMRPFLINGKNRFTSPTAIVDKLSIFSDAVGQQEVIDGEDVDTYALNTTPLEGSVFTFKINDENVRAVYNKDTNSVTFPRVIKAGETCTVIWYYAGAFTQDLSGSLSGDYPMTAIQEKIINILAHGLLSAWGENEMNRALEMRNILSDADMSFYSPANSARAKVEWHRQINRDMDTLIAELNWRIMATPRGGSRFGK